MADTVIQSAENVEVKNVPTSIPMPDHEIRTSRWFQIYVRLSRPTLDWIGALSVAFQLMVAPLCGIMISEGVLAISLGFVAGLYGIRSWEKNKGVA